MTRATAHQRRHCGHKSLHLTCEEFGALERDAGGRCGVCGVGRRLLRSDVDHGIAIGARAIRGMVCYPCKGLLHEVDRGRRLPSKAMRAYLAEPWFRRAGIDGRCPADCRYGEHRGWFTLPGRGANLKKAAPR